MNHTHRPNTHSPLKPQTWEFDYTGCTSAQLFEKLSTSENGLSDHEAMHRLEEYGYNEPAKKKKRHLLVEILSKFLNPLVICLLIIGGVSLFFGQTVNAILISIMALLSVVLSFVQEHRAGLAAEKLIAMVHTTATVLRHGKMHEIRISELVPGDLVDLSAGDMIPADVRIVSCKDFFLNQASITGESFPIEKTSTPSPELQNIAFMGSSVVSGSARAIVIKTGQATSFGEVFRKVSTMSVSTSFDRGVIQFTMLMVKAMLCLVACIFAIIALKEGDFLQALLFSLGVAVGLTPEMLPMIVTVTLSKGALCLSKKEVIVKRLNSIQNFGAMDVLCTDKTGTLTIDKIVLEKHCDIEGNENEDVLRFAYINSFYQTGLKNVLDKAILNHERLLVRQFEKIDEMPFDFTRKIMSVVVQMDHSHRLIAKGAPEEIFKRCTQYVIDGHVGTIEPAMIAELEKEYYTLSKDGFRVLAIGYKDMDTTRTAYSKEDEQGLTLKGYVAFYDPPKPTAAKAISSLKRLGIDFKVLTGDNELVTQKICTEVGLEVTNMITGEVVEKASDEELKTIVEKTNIFSRLLPLQKERVIRALRDNGHVVGYLGDGINDASALKTADVGISVNNAVDIAKESADLILLKKSLLVLKVGVIEGRKTFGNIIKYIKMGSSSNFGNMFSMTGASIFLPFLPMLPIQILLNNLLYDISQIAIPSDTVDKGYIVKPRPWNIDYIKKFMLVIGPISSIFDFLTFGVLLFLFQAQAPLFHTGWFLESLCTQTLVIHIIRTSRIPFVESCPSRFLFAMSIAIVVIGICIPLSPLGPYLGFVPPPPAYYGALALISGAYFLLVWYVKKWFVKKYGAL